MALDPLTLLFVSGLVVLLTVGTYLLAWLQDRQETAVLWLAASSVIGGGAMIGRGILPETPAVVLGNMGTLLALGLVWRATRMLRRATPWPALGGTATVLLAWTVSYAVPDIRAALNARVIIGSSLSCVLVFAALSEVWRGRSGRPGAVRLFVAALFGTLFALNAARCVRTVIVPLPPAPAWQSQTDYATVLLSTLVFTLLLSFGMVALVRERAEHRFRQASFRDPLTGLGNRRQFDLELERAFGRAARLHRPLALLMLDADHFKAYNDLYGHPAGDHCLQEVAAALAGARRRATDLAIRYGGEEFALLLPDTDAGEVRRVAERVRQAVRSAALAHEGSPQGYVTVSVGAGVGVPGADLQRPTDLLHMADQALYVAKRHGRNRVSVAAIGPPDQEASRRPSTPAPGEPPREAPSTAAIEELVAQPY